MGIENLENLGLQANFTPRERAYFDKLKAELLTLFDGRQYDEIKASKDTAKLKKISDKLAQMEEFVKTKNIPLSEIEVDPDLFHFDGRIGLPAQNEQFPVNELFKVDVSNTARVKFFKLGDRFLNWFSDMEIKPQPASKLSFFTLQQNSLYDKDLIRLFGGPERVETTLAQLWQLLESQQDGAPNILHKNAQVNTFCIRDKTNHLRLVNLFWLNNGWNIQAQAVSHNKLKRQRRFFVCR